MKLEYPVHRRHKCDFAYLFPYHAYEYEWPHTPDIALQIILIYLLTMQRQKRSQRLRGCSYSRKALFATAGQVACIVSIPAILGALSNLTSAVKA